MNWTIRYHPRATAAIYQIERGTAATVTEAIRHLGRNPHPPEATLLPDRPHSYSIDVAGHQVIYEAREVERIVYVLFIA